MKQGRMTWAILLVLFAVAITLVALMPKQTDLPYSSKSTSYEGTKAAFLLLEEFGFDVRRNTSKNWDGEGVLLALGAEYLQDTSAALILEDDYRYTNELIENYAYEFVSIMWEYRDKPVCFEEYSRSAMPIDNFDEYRNLTLSDITPFWVKLVLLHLAVIAFFVMFFYRQRIGKPIALKEFSTRRPLEGIYAMAGAMEAAHVYSDSARVYYNYRLKKGAQWDADKKIYNAVLNAGSEREALAVIAKLDQKMKEYYGNERS